MRVLTVLLMLTICFVAGMFSCRKSLDQEPVGLVDESKLANRKGVEELLIGAYSRLDGVSAPETGAFFANGPSNWIFGSVCGTEGYKGSSVGDLAPEVTPLETFQSTAINGGVVAKWRSLFTAIGRCNEVLYIMGLAKDIPAADQLRIEAEVRFLRGFYHFEAAKIWQYVPYVNEEVRYENDNYKLPNDTLIWGAIANDFRFAMENLPPVMNAPGRANKYAAQAFLIKTLVYDAPQNPGNYLTAKLLIDELMINGVTASGTPYKLLDKYRENFNQATENSSESIFAVQASVNDGSDGMNGNFGDIMNYPAGTSGTCCGFFQPSQYLVNHFRTLPVSGIPDFEHFNDDPIKSDDGFPLGEDFVPESRPIDPRLDWTVGRRDIPYLDWGICRGIESDWIRDTTEYGVYVPMKHSFYKSEQPGINDANFWNPTTTSANLNLFRYADFLLLAAEVEIELDHLDKAREYINQVRNRAANPDGFVRKSNGQPAANYFIKPYTEPFPDKVYAREAVRFERMLELGTEGHRFFDLVRWGIAAKEINYYLANEKKRVYLNNSKFRAGVNERFPIPQVQIDLCTGSDGRQILKQNEGY